MYEQPYIDYLVQFHGSRDYFECHEILEEHWKDAPLHERRKVWVGFIQIAVALYHQRRGNFAGAKKMLSSAIEILIKEPSSIERLGLNYDTLISQLNSRLKEIVAELPYTSMNLPITDPALLETCKNECLRCNWTWSASSNLNDHFLLHKHTERDRSDVIAERERQAQLRNQGQ